MQISKMRCLEKQSNAVRWYKRQVRSNVYLPRKPERQKHHVPLDKICPLQISKMRCLEKQSNAVRWYKRQVRSNVYLPRKPERQKHHVPLDTARYADHHHRSSSVSCLCGSFGLDCAGGNGWSVRLLDTAYRQRAEYLRLYPLCLSIFCDNTADFLLEVC